MERNTFHSISKVTSADPLELTNSTKQRNLEIRHKKKFLMPCLGTNLDYATEWMKYGNNIMLMHLL